MFVLGLTGSIGMGKTTVAGHIASRGIPVLDSDSIVHRLYAGDAVPHIEAAFPGTTSAGAVDRAKLSAALLAEDGGFARLEALVHPLVRQAQWDFLRQQAAAGQPLAVLDIPLLFETGGNELIDACIVVSAPADVQAARVLARPGMTPEKLDAIRARQLPDAEKRARADFVVDTGLAWEETRRQVDRILESLGSRPGTAMERWRRHFGNA
jgi:dephospho-CoA kinase